MEGGIWHLKTNDRPFCYFRLRWGQKLRKWKRKERGQEKKKDESNNINEGHQWMLVAITRPIVAPFPTL
jgi:hypothetical protein